MSKLHYFRYTFLIVSAGLTSGLVVYWLLTSDSYTLSAIGEVLLKSVFVGVFTALVLGILNMFFKIEPFKKK